MIKHHALLQVVRIVGLLLIILLYAELLDKPLDSTLAILTITGGVISTLPVVWLGRILLDQGPTVGRTAWVTTLVHYVLMLFLGPAIIEATWLAQARPGPSIPIPTQVGGLLMVITGTVIALTMLNLALSGLGAPIAIVLSRRLALNGLYRWTRNPMVLALFGFLFAEGLWLQSWWFLAWVIGLVVPAWLVFLKVFEERELEIRFGPGYIEYRNRTPMLWPRWPENAPTAPTSSNGLERAAEGGAGDRQDRPVGMRDD